MFRTSNKTTAFAIVSLGIWNSTLQGSSIVLRLVNPGPSEVAPGDEITLEVRADFDTPLTAASFELTSVGEVSAIVQSRSADPAEPNGLTYLSTSSQVPFESNLPHDLADESIREVLYDADFAENPGGPDDGIEAGDNILIESISLQAPAEGVLTLALTQPRAAETLSDPNGRLIDAVTIAPGQGEVTLVIGTGSASCDGDANGDDTVDPLDAGYVLARFGCTVVGGTADCQAADVNGDLVVDPLDAGFVLARFGTCNE